MAGRRACTAGRLSVRSTEPSARSPVLGAATAAAGEQRVTPLAVRCTPVKRLGSGELENQVLDVVWGATGPVTPRQVHEELSRNRKLAYTTVMTILVRLCKKGVLEREPAGRAFAYRPRISREERAAARMNDALTSAGDHSLALTRFVESLPPDQVDDLRSALRQAHSDQ